MSHRGTSADQKSGLRLWLGRIVHLLGWLVVIASLVFNWYLIGLLRHNPNSYVQLKAGGTAAFPGTVTKVSAKSITVKTVNNGTKTMAVKTETSYALFPKDYQTLIPIGLPSSKDDVVVKQTEASVSAQLPYLKTPQATRINLVRADVLTGKVIETSSSAIKFKGFAASGAKEETRILAGNVIVQKLGADGKLAAATFSDVKKDMGMYGFLDKPTSDTTGQITRLIVADFSTPVAQ
ncbi:MAG: hypothetical protein AAB647_03700 [Patescibacteria group bacterium]